MSYPDNTGDGRGLVPQFQYRYAVDASTSGRGNVAPSGPLPVNTRVLETGGEKGGSLYLERRHNLQLNKPPAQSYAWPHGTHEHNMPQVGPRAGGAAGGRYTDGYGSSGGASGSGFDSRHNDVRDDGAGDHPGNGDGGNSSSSASSSSGSSSSSSSSGSNSLTSYSSSSSSSDPLRRARTSPLRRDIADFLANPLRCQFFSACDPPIVIDDDAVDQVLAALPVSAEEVLSYLVALNTTGRVFLTLADLVTALRDAFELAVQRSAHDTLMRSVPEVDRRQVLAALTAPSCQLFARNDVVQVTSAQLARLVLEAGSVNQAVHIIENLSSRGRFFDSVDQLVFAVSAERMHQRIIERVQQDLLTFLQSDECIFFRDKGSARGSVPLVLVTPEDAAYVVDHSGAGVDTLVHVRALNAAQFTFPSIQALVTAVAEAHLDLVKKRKLYFLSDYTFTITDLQRQELLAFFHSAGKRLFTSSPSSSSSLSSSSSSSALVPTMGSGLDASVGGGIENNGTGAAADGNSFYTPSITATVAELDALLIQGRGLLGCKYYLTSLLEQKKTFGAFADLIVAVQVQHTMMRHSVLEYLSSSTSLLPVQLELTIAHTDRLLADGRAGPETLYYLRLFDAQNIHFNSLADLAQAVRKAHVANLNQRINAKIATLTYLYSPECRLLPRDLPTSDVDVRRLFDEGGHGTRQLLEALDRAGKRFRSMSDLIAGINQEKINSKQCNNEVLAYLLSTRCTLFENTIDGTTQSTSVSAAAANPAASPSEQGGNLLAFLDRSNLAMDDSSASSSASSASSSAVVPAGTAASSVSSVVVNAATVERLMHEGGAGAETLRVLWALEVKRERFRTWDDLILAVKATHGEALDTRKQARAMILRFLTTYNSASATSLLLEPVRIGDVELDELLQAARGYPDECVLILKTLVQTGFQTRDFSSLVASVKQMSLDVAKHKAEIVAFLRSPTCALFASPATGTGASTAAAAASTSFSTSFASEEESAFSTRSGALMTVDEAERIYIESEASLFTLGYLTSLNNTIRSARSHASSQQFASSSSSTGSFAAPSSSASLVSSSSHSESSSSSFPSGTTLLPHHRGKPFASLESLIAAIRAEHRRVTRAQDALLIFFREQCGLIPSVSTPGSSLAQPGLVSGAALDVYVNADTAAAEVASLLSPTSSAQSTTTPDTASASGGPQQSLVCLFSPAGLGEARLLTRRDVHNFHQFTGAGGNVISYLRRLQAARYVFPSVSALAASLRDLALRADAMFAAGLQQVAMRLTQGRDRLLPPEVRAKMTSFDAEQVLLAADGSGEAALHALNEIDAQARRFGPQDFSNTTPNGGVVGAFLFTSCAQLAAAVADTHRNELRRQASIVSMLRASAGLLLDSAMFDPRGTASASSSTSSLSSSSSASSGADVLADRTREAMLADCARALAGIIPVSVPVAAVFSTLRSRRFGKTARGVFTSWEDLEAAVRDIVDARRADDESAEREIVTYLTRSDTLLLKSWWTSNGSGAPSASAAVSPSSLYFASGSRVGVANSGQNAALYSHAVRELIHAANGSGTTCLSALKHIEERALTILREATNTASATSSFSTPSSSSSSIPASPSASVAVGDAGSASGAASSSTAVTLLSSTGSGASVSHDAVSEAAMKGASLAASPSAARLFSMLTSVDGLAQLVTEVVMLPALEVARILSYLTYGQGRVLLFGSPSAQTASTTTAAAPAPVLTPADVQRLHAIAVSAQGPALSSVLEALAAAKLANPQLVVGGASFVVQDPIECLAIEVDRASNRFAERRMNTARTVYAWMAGQPLPPASSISGDSREDKTGSQTNESTSLVAESAVLPSVVPESFLAHLKGAVPACSLFKFTPRLQRHLSLPQVLAILADASCPFPASTVSAAAAGSPDASSLKGEAGLGSAGVAFDSSVSAAAVGKAPADAAALAATQQASTFGSPTFLFASREAPLGTASAGPDASSSGTSAVSSTVDTKDAFASSTAAPVTAAAALGMLAGNGGVASHLSSSSSALLSSAQSSVLASQGIEGLYADTCGGLLSDADGQLAYELALFHLVHLCELGLRVTSLRHLSDVLRRHHQNTLLQIRRLLVHFNDPRCTLFANASPPVVVGLNEAFSLLAKAYRASPPIFSSCAPAFEMTLHLWSLQVAGQRFRNLEECFEGLQKSVRNGSDRRTKACQVIRRALLTAPTSENSTPSAATASSASTSTSSSSGAGQASLHSQLFFSDAHPLVVPEALLHAMYEIAREDVDGVFALLRAVSEEVGPGFTSVYHLVQTMANYQRAFDAQVLRIRAVLMDPVNPMLVPYSPAAAHPAAVAHVLRVSDSGLSAWACVQHLRQLGSRFKSMDELTAALRELAQGIRAEQEALLAYLRRPRCVLLSQGPPDLAASLTVMDMRALIRKGNSSHLLSSRPATTTTIISPSSSSAGNGSSSCSSTTEVVEVDVSRPTLQRLRELDNMGMQLASLADLALELGTYSSQIKSLFPRVAAQLTHAVPKLSPSFPAPWAEVDAAEFMTRTGTGLQTSSLLATIIDDAASAAIVHAVQGVLSGSDADDANSTASADNSSNAGESVATSPENVATAAADKDGEAKGTAAAGSADADEKDKEKEGLTVSVPDDSQSIVEPAPPAFTAFDSYDSLVAAVRALAEQQRKERALAIQLANSNAQREREREGEVGSGATDGTTSSDRSQRLGDEEGAALRSPRGNQSASDAASATTTTTGGMSDVDKAEVAIENIRLFLLSPTASKLFAPSTSSSDPSIASPVARPEEFVEPTTSTASTIYYESGALDETLQTLQDIVAENEARANRREKLMQQIHAQRRDVAELTEELYVAEHGVSSAVAAQDPAAAAAAQRKFSPEPVVVARIRDQLLLARDALTSTSRAAVLCMPPQYVWDLVGLVQAVRQRHHERRLIAMAALKVKMEEVKERQRDAALMQPSASPTSTGGRGTAAVGQLPAILPSLVTPDDKLAIAQYLSLPECGLFAGAAPGGVKLTGADLVAILSAGRSRARTLAHLVSLDHQRRVCSTPTQLIRAVAQEHNAFAVRRRELLLYLWGPRCKIITDRAKQRLTAQDAETLLLMPQTGGDPGALSLIMQVLEDIQAAMILGHPMLDLVDRPLTQTQQQQQQQQQGRPLEVFKSVEELLEAVNRAWREHHQAIKAIARQAEQSQRRRELNEQKRAFALLSKRLADPACGIFSRTMQAVVVTDKALAQLLRAGGGNVESALQVLVEMEGCPGRGGEPPSYMFAPIKPGDLDADDLLPDVPVAPSMAAGDEDLHLPPSSVATTQQWLPVYCDSMDHLVSEADRWVRSWLPLQGDLLAYLNRPTAQQALFAPPSSSSSSSSSSSQNITPSVVIAVSSADVMQLFRDSLMGRRTLPELIRLVRRVKTGVLPRGRFISLGALTAYLSARARRRIHALARWQRLLLALEDSVHVARDVARVTMGRAGIRSALVAPSFAAFDPAVRVPVLGADLAQLYEIAEVEPRALAAEQEALRADPVVSVNAETKQGEATPLKHLGVARAVDILSLADLAWTSTGGSGPSSLARFYLALVEAVVRPPASLKGPPIVPVPAFKRVDQLITAVKALVNAGVIASPLGPQVYYPQLQSLASIVQAAVYPSSASSTSTSASLPQTGDASNNAAKQDSSQQQAKDPSSTGSPVSPAASTNSATAVAVQMVPSSTATSPPVVSDNVELGPAVASSQQDSQSMSAAAGPDSTAAGIKDQSSSTSSTASADKDKDKDKSKSISAAAAASSSGSAAKKTPMSTLSFRVSATSLPFDAPVYGAARASSNVRVRLLRRAVAVLSETQQSTLSTAVSPNSGAPSLDAFVWSCQTEAIQGTSSPSFTTVLSASVPTAVLNAALAAHAQGQAAPSAGLLAARLDIIYDAPQSGGTAQTVPALGSVVSDAGVVCRAQFSLLSLLAASVAVGASPARPTLSLGTTLGGSGKNGGGGGGGADAASECRLHLWYMGVNPPLPILRALAHAARIAPSEPVSSNALVPAGGRLPMGTITSTALTAGQASAQQQQQQQRVLFRVSCVSLPTTTLGGTPCPKLSLLVPVLMPSTNPSASPALTWVSAGQESEYHRGQSSPKFLTVFALPVPSAAASAAGRGSVRIQVLHADPSVASQLNVSSFTAATSTSASSSTSPTATSASGAAAAAAAAVAASAAGRSHVLCFAEVDVRAIANATEPIAVPLVLAPAPGAGQSANELVPANNGLSILRVHPILPGQNSSMIDDAEIAASVSLNLQKQQLGATKPSSGSSTSTSTSAPQASAVNATSSSTSTSSSSSSQSASSASSSSAFSSAAGGSSAAGSTAAAAAIDELLDTQILLPPFTGDITPELQQALTTVRTKNFLSIAGVYDLQVATASSAPATGTGSTSTSTSTSMTSLTSSSNETTYIQDRVLLAHLLASVENDAAAVVAAVNTQAEALASNETSPANSLVELRQAIVSSALQNAFVAFFTRPGVPDMLFTGPVQADEAALMALYKAGNCKLRTTFRALQLLLDRGNQFDSIDTLVEAVRTTRIQQAEAALSYAQMQEVMQAFARSDMHLFAAYPGGPPGEDLQVNAAQLGALHSACGAITVPDTLRVIDYLNVTQHRYVYFQNLIEGAAKAFLNGDHFVSIANTRIIADWLQKGDAQTQGLPPRLFGSQTVSFTMEQLLQLLAATGSTSFCLSVLRAWNRNARTFSGGFQSLLDAMKHEVAQMADICDMTLAWVRSPECTLVQRPSGSDPATTQSTLIGLRTPRDVYTLAERTGAGSQILILLKQVQRLRSPSLGPFTSAKYIEDALALTVKAWLTKTS